VGITWQTLRGAILANIKEFASLRALGVSMGDLRMIVMELGFWVGIAGLAATGVLVFGATAAGQRRRRAHELPDPDRHLRRRLPDPHRHALGADGAGHPQEQPTGGPAAMSAFPPPGATAKSAVVAKGLVKRFKTGRTYIEVLKDVDFDALHGDVTMVMGPSGSGKSTLVACLSGLLGPTPARSRR
jgi:ABC-type multidrug transport system fused ATPase/permease subunit